MQLSAEQIQQMAPDEASVNAGKKLQSVKLWQNLGKSDLALWGECLGSATYQVRVDLSNLGYKCSCPSRKFPCKHVLGLLFMAAQTGKEIPAGSPPDWITDWLSKRQESAAKKESKDVETPKPVDEKAQKKRSEQRHERVAGGLEQLDLWLQDLVRRGLAGLEQQGAKPWEEQARRLVDAQAPGLAARLRRLGELPGSHPEWPMLLLGQLGKLKLAIRAFQRIDRLEPNLAMDLRQWIGWSISSEELDHAGEKVIDDWQILGQWIDDDDRIRTQRTWCQGRETGRLALVLQFSAGVSQFPASFMPGTWQRGTMVFYPGASKQRAQFTERDEQIHLIETAFTGHETIEAFLCDVAKALAQQPWLEAFGSVLNNVSLTRHDEKWYVRDLSGQSLPLVEYDAWRLSALTGGHPFHVAGEWTGMALRPLGAFVEGVFRLP